MNRMVEDRFYDLGEIAEREDERGRHLVRVTETNGNGTPTSWEFVQDLEERP